MKPTLPDQPCENIHSILSEHTMMSLGQKLKEELAWIECVQKRQKMAALIQNGRQPVGL